MKQKIIISSTNPVKLNSTLAAFKSMFPEIDFTIDGVSVPSGVADQPMSEQETMQGALNRVDNAFQQYPEADYWVGIEGGVEKMEDEMLTFAWVFIKDKNNKLGKGRSASFFLPVRVVELINQGKELGDADDIVFGKNNSKQQNGAPGLLTHDVVTRTDLYTHTVLMALIPFKNPTLY